MADIKPERWTLRVHDRPEAALTIPPDARRERRFDIACALTVRCPDPLAGAWHQMTVFANGKQQWQRRVPSHNPGSRDGLDLHFRATVPVGEALKVLVRVAVKGAAIERVEIEADEG
jgi:hypothetical protein